ncbi:MAG: hypothetical protein ACI4HK_09090 [Ruminococcus sp.]
MNNKNTRQIYQSVFNEVHASEELLKNIKNMSNSPKRKKSNYKFITAVAACLVCVILGTTIISSINGGENSFILKADAAEIGGDSLIKMTAVSPNAGLSGSVTNGDNKEITMGSISPFTVICNGKNVQTVKYTIKNGVFLFPYSSYAKDYRNTYPDAAALSDKIYDKAAAEQKIKNNIENEEQYVSYTLNYSDQTELEKYTDLQTFPIQIFSSISSNDDISDKAKKALTNYISVNPDSEGKYTNSLSDKEYISELMNAFQIVYDEMYSKIYISVEVTYTDGTAENETLQLGCERVNEKEGIVIGAKVVK